MGPSRKPENPATSSGTMHSRSPVVTNRRHRTPSMTDVPATATGSSAAAVHTPYVFVDLGVSGSSSDGSSSSSDGSYDSDDSDDSDSGPEADARRFVRMNPPCPPDKVWVMCSFPAMGRSAEACLPRSDVISCTTEAQWMSLISSSGILMLVAWARWRAVGDARARLGSGPAGCCDTLHFKPGADWLGKHVSDMPRTTQPWIVFSERVLV